MDAALELFSSAESLRPGALGSTQSLAQHPYTSALARASSRGRVLAWSAHTRTTHSDVPAPSFSTDASHKLLLITVDDPICRSQVFPLFYYQPELRGRFGLQLRETPLAQFEADPGRGPGGADTVCLQTWFDLTPSAVEALLSKVRKHNPDARLVYLDWFAPTDLRLAHALHGHVDMYVKKHVFRDRARYADATFGDTNLMDFYGRLYGLRHETAQFQVPEGFFQRMLVGPSFATADYMLPKFLYGRVPNGPRPVDLHARISTKGTPWYNQMRNHASDALSGMTDLQVVTGTGVARRQYLRELAQAKLCFSPFGYGEVCWRDYEAVMCGSLLIKPDMSHVETDPDIFQAGESYVPIRWDFSDLEEKVRYYLAHAEERQKITDNAFRVVSEYFRQQRFFTQMRAILDPGPRAVHSIAQAR